MKALLWIIGVGVVLAFSKGQTAAVSRGQSVPGISPFRKAVSSLPVSSQPLRRPEISNMRQLYDALGMERPTPFIDQVDRFNAEALSGGGSRFLFFRLDKS